MADETLNDLIAQLCDADKGLTPSAVEDLILRENADLMALAERILLTRLQQRPVLPYDAADMRRLSLHSLWSALIHQVTTLEVLLDNGPLFTMAPAMPFSEFETRMQKPAPIDPA